MRRFKRSKSEWKARGRMRVNDRLPRPQSADLGKPTLDSQLADNTHLVW